MAVRLKAALKAALATMFADNDNFEISAMDARQQLTDHIDSLLSGPDVQATDSSIVVDRSTPGVVRLSADTSGGTPVPTSYPTLRFGTSADDTPEAGELTIVGALGRGTIVAYVGEMHQLIARLASEGDISSVVYSDDPSQDNAFGAFAKWPATVDIGGEAWNVWVSNQQLMHPNDATLTVS